MPTFNITSNGYSAAQVLGAASTALFMGGVFGGATIRVEISPNGTEYAPISCSQELRGSGKSPAVGGCVIPAGWRVRVFCADAGANTAIVVVVI